MKPGFPSSPFLVWNYPPLGSKFGTIIWFSRATQTHHKHKRKRPCVTVETGSTCAEPAFTVTQGLLLLRLCLCCVCVARENQALVAFPVCRWCLSKVWSQLYDCHGRLSLICDRIGRRVVPCVYWALMRQACWYSQHCSFSSCPLFILGRSPARSTRTTLRSWRQCWMAWAWWRTTIHRPTGA